MNRTLYFLRAVLILLFTLANVAYGSGDTTHSKTDLPFSYFQQRGIEGTSSARVTGTDVGVSGITFKNPYSPTANMTTWAGFFKGTIDGVAAKFYCIDISHYIAFYSTSQPHTYTDNGNTPGTITYILNNYYPNKPLPYSGSLGANDEAASVQIAIWHFSDGLNVSTVTNSTIKNRALAIISAANANSATVSLLTSFSLLPASQTVALSAPGVLYAKALDASNNPISGLVVNFTTTSGTLSASSSTTNSSGVTSNINLTKGSNTQATVTATTSYVIPQGTKYEHTISPNNYQKLVLATPTTANRQSQATVTWQNPNPGCTLTGFATYTQGGWGSPSNSTPGALRDSKFSLVFPTGMTVGGTKTAKFNSATAIKNFLPQGGTASKFTTNYVDPTSTSAGVFGGQLVALMLNVKFSDAGYLGTNSLKLGQLVITTGPLAGKTVYDVLNYANIVIGGGTATYTIAELNTAADNINNNFDNGTQDLGFLTCPAQQPVTIGDRLWLDANKNGTQDAGESGYAGVTVKLYDCNNNLKATTTTDANGYYLFANITPGSYYIQFSLPANYSFSAKNQGSDPAKDSDVDPATGKTTCYNFTSGSNDLTWDAGIYYSKAKLGDRVWNDFNANGIQDGTETGISGVTVKLYTCTGTLIATTTTDGDGDYLFPDLAAGSYYVNFTLPSSYTFSPKNQGSDAEKDSDPDPATGNTACVTLAAMDNNLTVDAGMYTQRAAIGDYVWNDVNKNGIQDAGEAGIANVTVKLYDCSNNLIATTTTDNSGFYKFTNVVTGSYYVQFTLPPNYSFTLKNQGGNTTKDSDADPATGKTTCTSLAPGQTDLTWDAGMYFIKGSLGDKVWNDINENGVQDNGEPGVQNVTVKLYDCSNNTLLATTVTDANGNYLFANLNAGSYYVVFSAPADYEFTEMDQGTDESKDSDPDPSNGKTSCVTIAAGDNNMTVDAGIYVKKATIGDKVWKDLNQDGKQDDGEPGLSDVTVKLYDCNDNFIGTATTDNDGLYKFMNLSPGSYYLQFFLPAGYSFSPANQGSDPSKDSDADVLTGKTTCVNLPPGVTDLTLDAGMFQPKASVGDKVWEDLNRDGNQDNPLSELGFPGVVVNLYDCNNVLISTTTTDGNGNYLFLNLEPGSYNIQFVAPSGYAITAKNNGSDPTIDSDADPLTGKTTCFTLAPGENNPTIDCGIYLNKCSVGDFVWKDINMNGIQDAGEPAISDVVVRLFDCSDNVIATTVTDASGSYSFTNLTPGGYYVQFFLPTGYSFSPQMAGTNVAVDSDPDITTGKTACVTLNPGTNVITWDAGMYETAATYSDLRVTKTADKMNVQNNETVTYTITVTNYGPSANSGVSVSDILPGGLQYISSTPAGYNETTGIWTVGALANGESKSLQIQVKIDVTNLNNTVVDLGPAKPFNMFVIEDMTVPSSDTQGKLAVGRDANLQGYSVGDQLPNSNGTEDVLVVGRDLTFLTGRVYNGNVVYGNTTNLPKYSVSIEEGTLRKDNVIDFAAAKTYLNSLSTQLSAQVVNGTTVYQPFHEVTMTGTDPFLNVFFVDGAQLSTANNTSINVPNGSVVLVNISGHDVSWGYGLQVNGTSYNNALYNFYEAEDLYIHGIDVIGSILAPKADVYFQAGVQHGQMICKSYRGQGQLNLDPFIGNLPVSMDIVNITEVKTADKYDPNSTPNNGDPGENDYASATVHVGVVAPSSPNFQQISTVPGNNAPLTLSNNSAGQVFAGTAGGQIYSSDNDGTSWTNISASLNNVKYVSTISFGPAKSQRIIAGTSEGVYTSDNNGAVWDTTNLMHKDIRKLIASADGRMYAGVWGSGVYQSIDQGRTWLPMNTGLGDLRVNSIYLDNNSELLAATFGGGIFKYSVMNSLWVPVQIDYPYVWSLHTTKNGILFATTYGAGVYRSENGGDSWTKINNGLSNLYIYSLTEDKNNNLIAISWSGGVYQMPLGSSEWLPLGLDGAGISSVAINSVSNAILVGAKNGAVFSKNGPLGVKNTSQVPTEFSLSQNYPNPFNPSTKINFSIPKSGHVTLDVYNILGQLVTRLVDAEMNAGSYTATFNGDLMSSGIYIYRLTANNTTLQKKMMFVK